MENPFTPHWAKFILPLFAVGAFFLLISQIFAWAAFADRYTCESISLMEALTAIGLGDYELQGNGDILLTRLNRTVDNETQMRWQRMGEEMAESKEGQGGFWDDGIPALSLDPIFPVPCEMIQVGSANRDSCVWYVSEETHGCLYKESVYVQRDESGIIPYRSVSVLLLAANALVIFIFWYAVSCVIFFAYGKAKKMLGEGK